MHNTLHKSCQDSADVWTALLGLSFAGTAMRFHEVLKCNMPAPRFASPLVTAPPPLLTELKSCGLDFSPMSQAANVAKFKFTHSALSELA